MRGRGGKSSGEEEREGGGMGSKPFQLRIKECLPVGDTPLVPTLRGVGEA